MTSDKIKAKGVSLLVTCSSSLVSEVSAVGTDNSGHWMIGGTDKPGLLVRGTAKLQPVTGNEQQATCDVRQATCKRMVARTNANFVCP